MKFVRRGDVLVGLVSILLFSGAGRLAYIEYAQGDELRSKAARQQTAMLPIPAQRGEILDTRGRVLAGSTRFPCVYMDPSDVDDARFAAYSIAPIFDGVEASELYDTILARRSHGFVWVKRDVPEDELAAFQEIRGERRLGAFVVRYEPRRDYPYGSTAAHVVGFVGGTEDPNLPPRLGLAGIEQRFDSVLRGTDGKRTMTVDVRRRSLRSRLDEYEPPRDGASVFLTIDVHIQQRAEQHLRAAVEEFVGEWGVALVMDPQAGEVLAMATYPTYEPQQPIPLGISETAPEYKAARERLENRAIQESYEPGSMFKPIIFSSALNEGLISIDEPIAVNGPVRSFGRRTIHDVGVTLGTVPAHRIISKSSNIGMTVIGLRSGNERLHGWIKGFGFGDRTGIQLPGESYGLVQDLSLWTSFSTPSVSFGQEIAVTPLQMLTAFCAICNGGILYQPRIVRGVVSPDGEVLADYSEPIVRRRVLRPEVADEFRMTALTAVVSPEGTGRKAILPDYQVFGKTATAQIATTSSDDNLEGEREGYEDNAYMASFICGAPADNPQVAVLVSVCRPKGKSYYGGAVSAPAAAAILADTLAYLHVPPQNADN